jgi:hypothetical protein
VLDVASSIDEDPDLAPDLPADLRQRASELVADEAVGGKAPPEQALELADLVGLQAAGVAEYLDGYAPGDASRASRPVE